MSEQPIDRVSILGSESIHVGLNMIPYMVSKALGLNSSCYVLVTDSNLAGRHLSTFEQEFATQAAGASRFFSYVIPPGEESKSRTTKADIEDFLLSQRCTRDTVILALGGGVVGDLVGFVAATFMRGVRVIQIPTTLLAMVDSSVGGKTAIDVPLGKNLIGAFHQPTYIFIDAAFLSTLPRREFVNGMAEVIKTAAIWDADEFAKLENGVESIHSALDSASENRTGIPTPEQALLISVIKASIATKAHIVTVDEKETGLRNLVNFGHTIGHAIEAVVTPDVLHGECVAVGMVLEAEVARSLGVLGNAAVGRIIRCLKAHGLPTSLKEGIFLKTPKTASINIPRLLDVMSVDKKNAGAVKKIVLLSRIGKTHEERATGVADAVIRRVLAEAVYVAPGLPKASFTLATPGSKSISNRALVLAALATGTCRLSNLLHSDDTQVMMAALEAMHGARFDWEGDDLIVTGGGGSLSRPRAPLYLGNAGTAARFLTTVCTLIPEGPAVTTGNARMKQRPIGPLVDALRANGASISYLESEGCLPLEIGGGGLAGGRIQLAASVSSQYVSSILLCAPYAREEVTLELVGGAVISQPYIDMTIAMMAQFGVNVTSLGQNTYRIPRSAYAAPAAYAIESDASSATYPLAVAALTGTTCTVHNIGSASLQGDARFARDILAPMGCVVHQTATETTVTGPPIGQLKALGAVDMEPMTDAFLTASVLAAVARGETSGDTAPHETRIRGIANQRVKECNRIAAMRTELAKFGVATDEFDDGIIVYGSEISQLTRDPSVHCYDDHRVAMAFSVLCLVAGGTLEEKRCVEKTWPSWWDDLENKMGVPVVGAEVASGGEEGAQGHSAEGVSAEKPAPSIFILGMRGAGKTHLSRLGAAALGWTVVDADEYLERTFPEVSGDIKAFVHANGWPAFRALETAALKRILETYPERHIISLGGGVVESAENRALLAAAKSRGVRIIEVTRPIADVVAYLNSEPGRPSLLEDLHAIYARRAPLYEELADFVYCNDEVVAVGADDAAKSADAAAVTRFFRFVAQDDMNRVALRNAGGTPTYFLSLTFPALTDDVLAQLPALTAGVDAIELRVDLLSPDGPVTAPHVPPAEYVAQQLARLRRASSLPVVYTVRTHSQGGMLRDDATEAIFSLIRLGFKSACEYVDVEARWSDAQLAALQKEATHAHIICSWHDWSGDLKWGSPEMARHYARARTYGDIAKLVTRATHFSDNLAMARFRESVGAGEGGAAPPLMTLNIGEVGQLSRVLSQVFGPVTHELLPSAAAPGQLSVRQINAARSLIGLLPARHFYLFGTPIGHSKSPLIQNTGFSLLGLPHTFELFETDACDSRIADVVRGPTFGGAAVTIPYKQDVMALLDSVSVEAQAIQAVNTITAVDGKLQGDNTDWLALRDLVVAGAPAANSESAALVLGSGGTARAAIYALHRAGYGTIFVYNRTPANAEALVASFPAEYGLRVAPTLSALSPAPTAVISTVPGAAISTEYVPTPDAGIVAPASLFASPAGVVIDAAYKPKITPLLDLAQRTAPGWTVVPGIEMLLAGCCAQFEIWTGARAPRELISARVLEVYDAEQK